MAVIKQIVYQLRYILPLWLVQLLTNWLPENRISFRIRGALISPFIGKCGKKLAVSRNVMFLNSHGVELGDNVYIAPYCWLDGMGGLIIESEVKLSPFVVISTSSHCFVNNSVALGGSRLGSVKIGKGSWLASHVVVAAGVTIGSGAKVGSNAVVTKDLPDNIFAGGVPAKVIGQRIDEESEIYSRFE